MVWSQQGLWIYAGTFRATDLLKDFSLSFPL